MLKEVIASKAAKIIAACVCPVVGTTALTLSVPQVRQAVHKATAPRAYAKPKTRVRAEPTPPPVQTAMTDCPPVFVGNDSSIAPLLASPDSVLPPREFAGGPPGTPGFPFVPGSPGGPGGPSGPNPPTPPNPPGPPPAVPEPAAWIQMIIGFGVIGGATRVTYRRQRRFKLNPPTNA
nr:PEPxxWA-CTERM sorting domain-containing protein [Sphingomonas sp. SCN 67-18]